MLDRCLSVLDLLFLVYISDGVVALWETFHGYEKIGVEFAIEKSYYCFTCIMCEMKITFSTCTTSWKFEQDVIFVFFIALLLRTSFFGWSPECFLCCRHIADQIRRR